MATLTLIDLTSNRHWTFQFNPDSVRTQRRVNWRPQDTTIGTKPLMYENTDPKVLTFPELWFDESDTNRSITPLLADLETFTTREVEGRGAPPPLLATWGDRRERCVLQDLTIEETFFNDDLAPIRAKVSMELIELQEER